MVDPVSPTTIQALVWIVYGGPVAALTTAALVSWRGWRARESRGAPAGSESFFGRVAPTSDFRAADDGAELVRIEIVQEPVSGAFLEVERGVTASPFELSLADGRRLRVEPDARAVVAELEVASATRNRRSSVGRLLAGQEAHVTGVLAANGHLVPPSRGRMIISHAPLTDDARRMARFHLRAALILMNLFFASHGLLLMRYDRMLFRHDGAAEVDPSNVVLALGVFLFVAANYWGLWRARRPWYVMRRYFSGGEFARR